MIDECREDFDEIFKPSVDYESRKVAWDYCWQSRQKEIDRLVEALNKAKDDIDTCRSLLQSPTSPDRVVKYRNYLINQLPAMDEILAKYR